MVINMNKVGVIIRIAAAVILAIIGTAYASSSVFAEQTDNGLIYEINENGVKIIGYDGDAENISIPETIRGRSVIEIEEYAFYRSGIRSIELPETITKIGECAFCRADMLESINIPDGVKRIENGVFSECESLKEIDIPKNTEYIESGAFGGCFMLERINVSEENKYYTDVDGILYTKDKKVLAAYPNGRTSDICIVEEGTEKIMDFAFYCANVRYVKLPQSVKEIGQAAFLRAYLLEEVNVPDGVKSIDETTFACCRNLKKLVLPPSVSIIK